MDEETPLHDPIEALRCVFRYIQASERPLLAMDAVSYVIKLSIENNDTIPIIAKRHGVSPEEFKRVIRDFRECFGLETQT